MPAYWHGGLGGLDAGDWLEPRTSSGIWRPDNVLCELKAAGIGPAWVFEQNVVQPRTGTDRVYVAAKRMTAWNYAVGYTMWLRAIGAPGAGVLYRADPDGPVEPDLDSDTEDGAYTAARARITAIEAAVPFPDTPPYRLAVAKLAECYQVWKAELNGGADRWP